MNIPMTPEAKQISHESGPLKELMTDPVDNKDKVVLEDMRHFLG